MEQPVWLSGAAEQAAAVAAGRLSHTGCLAGDVWAGVGYLHIQ